MTKKYIRSQPLIAVSVRVQSHENVVYFNIQRYTPFHGFALFRNDNGTGPVRCSRTIYREVPRALNALWIEIGKYMEDCYKSKLDKHDISIETFETA